MLENSGLFQLTIIETDKGKVKEMAKSENSYIYMIRCSDNSIYTGITKNVERRMKEHFQKEKEGAKYTKAHQMVRLEVVFEAPDWSSAARLEYAIKRLKKEKKEQLIKQPQLVNELFGDRFASCQFSPCKLQWEVTTL